MLSFTILQVVETPFYLKGDFYIFLLLAVAGLVFSVLSWIQAKGAKKAAEDAGKIVKIQDILLDIPEITNLCQLDFADDYKKANPQITTIIGKISLVIGVIKEDAANNQSQLALITDLETTISQIGETLKSLNPIYMTEVLPPAKDIEGKIYYSIAPYLQVLVGQLNRLSGNLHGKMIQNNK